MSAGVTTIECGGMGAHVDWEKNHKRSNALGLSDRERCAHCQKPLTDGAGWWVNWNWGTDALVPLDETADVEALRLGNECARRLYAGLDPADRARFFRKAEETL